ncbi:MAG: DUF5682 family protein [Intrasporangiaceae bacterium]|nr:DUF5682 family protein [Intrasporangiaceae bacterium]
MPVHVLGIRHHGPGSARSVAAALDELEPDAVVIEGAPELDAVSALAADPGLVPPVAGLVYALDSPSQAAFYPLAAFSPEWVALQWALSRGVPVRFADLPQATAFALAAKEAADREARERKEQELEEAGVTPLDLGWSTDSADSDSAGDSDSGWDGGADGGAEPGGDSDPRSASGPGAPGSPSDAKAESRALRTDPISVLARVAGYEDPERWWEDAIEHRIDSVTARFAQITAAMGEVRRAYPGLHDLENQRREAFMRKVVREVMGAHETVVVVCGAFHAPALVAESFPSRAADTRVLARLPKTKVGATWAPWTNERLTYTSGYGAGVAAPGWYHHLFTGEAAGDLDVMAGWLVKVARVLRREQLPAAPASAVEAVRLADALAAVRGRPSAGLEELDDAALAVLCEGSEERLDLVRRELFVGDVLGEVPDHTPMVPLAQDLIRQQRTLRLQQNAHKLIEVDLRKPAQLARSVLFHRLRLLGVPWGNPVETSSTGTFKESWELKWEPEFAITLVEASRYGTTIASASSAVLAERAESADLPRLSALVEAALLADLGDGLAAVVERLAVATARSHDVRELMGAVEPLARTVRYGDVRGLDTEALHALVRVIVTRVSVGLRAGTQALDDDLAASTRSALESTHRGIALLDDPGLLEPWLGALGGLGDDVHGTLGGRVDRILLDAGRISSEVAAQRMSRRLSVAADAQQAVAWLESFLTGDAVLLLHDVALLEIVDEWVSGIAEESFEDLLPLLRRAFSRFSPPERSQLGGRLAHGIQQGSAGTGAAGPDLGAAAPVIRTTARWLGLDWEVPA